MIGFGRKESKIPKNATWRLTEDGKQKLMSGNGSPQMRVMIALETATGSLDSAEISQYSGLSRGQVERLIPVLIDRGYLSRAGAGSSFGGGDSIGDDEGR